MEMNMHISKRIIAVLLTGLLTAGRLACSRVGRDEEAENPLSFFNHKETIHFWDGDESLTD